jgi:hypothetical protein
MKRNLWTYVEGQLKDNVNIALSDLVMHQVMNNVIDHVWDQVYLTVKNQVGYNVTDYIWSGS